MTAGMKEGKLKKTKIPIIHPTDEDLERLVAEVDDVSDPSSINKIIEFLEQIQDADDEFMKILTDRIGNAQITWDLPWYQRTPGISRAQNDTGDYKDTFKKNAINSEEHEIIAQNWRKLRKVYGLQKDGLTSVARWRNRHKTRSPYGTEEKARRFVILFLANGLQRNPHQIYLHIRSHYGPSRKGFYTRTEDKIIEICFHHRPTLVRTLLAHALGRDPASVYKKMLIMHRGKPDSKKRLKWTLPLASKFLNLLMKYTGLELEELKNRRFDFDVWLQLEQDMDQHNSFLQHFWYCYLHVQLFVRCDVKLNKLKRRLFRRLRDSSYRIWSDIDWKEFVLDFPDGFTSRFIYKICFRMIKNYNPHYLKAPLKDVAEYGLRRIRRKGRTRNKRLKTLCLNEDGQLELTDYK